MGTPHWLKALLLGSTSGEFPSCHVFTLEPQVPTHEPLGDTLEPYSNLITTRSCPLPRRHPHTEDIWHTLANVFSVQSRMAHLPSCAWKLSFLWRWGKKGHLGCFHGLKEKKNLPNQHEHTHVRALESLMVLWREVKFMCGLTKRCVSGGGGWGPLSPTPIKQYLWLMEKIKETLNSTSVRKQRGNRNCGSARNLPFTEPTNHRKTKRNGKIWY